MDAPYLRIATYFSGKYKGNYVYNYKLKGKPDEVVLPNKDLTCLEGPYRISFNIPKEAFLGEQGPLIPSVLPRKQKKVGEALC